MLLGVHNQNTINENGDFHPLYVIMSRKRQVKAHTATVCITLIAVNFFASDLHTHTAVARLPLRQRGFFLVKLRLLKVLNS